MQLKRKPELKGRSLHDILRSLETGFKKLNGVILTRNDVQVLWKHYEEMKTDHANQALEIIRLKDLINNTAQVMRG